MKFLIQTIDKKIVHDFSFTLIESCKYQNWIGNKVKYKLTDNNLVEGYIPIGSVEFVSKYLNKFYNKVPKPINIPPELLSFEYTSREIYFGTKEDVILNKFVKSTDKIKYFTEIVNDLNIVPEGNYMISDIINIDSEWRSFIYNGQLVGLQNYAGDFTLFPDVSLIKKMISSYKNCPVSYTLDVGVNSKGTFIIEAHDFFSCGLYGFSEHRILPFMFSRWFNEYIKK